MEFGSIEAKRKGGLVSQQRRRENPEYYRSLGCNVPNSFVLPRRSRRLAEFIGIVLGDGDLTKTQLHITLNSIADADYLAYILELSKKIF